MKNIKLSKTISMRVNMIAEETCRESVPNVLLRLSIEEFDYPLESNGHLLYNVTQNLFGRLPCCGNGITNIGIEISSKRLLVERGDITGLTENVDMTQIKNKYTLYVVDV